MLFFSAGQALGWEPASSSSQPDFFFFLVAG
jgi:hypothetical protein